jgi:valyl-tRNA synthetase
MSDIDEQFPTRFNFSHAEPRIYENWMKQGYFHSEPDPARERFSIVIPPPNVTGALHLGHALNNTLQDVLVRFKRMQGYNTLWMPGTDHAGIATQAVVERRLKEESGKSRHDLGREKLVQLIWQWKDQYEGRIVSQLKQLGASCDWDRSRFTLDEQCARAVRYFFFDLFKNDRIYRGKRLVNWDTHLGTAVSDDEVFSQTVKGHFWHLRYPVIDPQPGEPDFVVVATTRPETMLGDTAVAVHPEPAKALEKLSGELHDKLSKASEGEKSAISKQLEMLTERREGKLLKLEMLRDMANAGRKIRLPLMDREIPLICDSWAKPELGSGCVKITPAHDPNDYEVGKRHHLDMLNVMNFDGTMNAEAGKYAGLSLKDARKQVVSDLESLDLIDQVEDREIELPHSDRSKTPIEPMLADQWFVRMNELAQTAIDAVENNRVKIIPQRYSKGYLDWLGEKRDWPVSRQLWWGHQIPVWSIPCEDGQRCQQLQQRVRDLDHFDDSTVSIQVEPCDETDENKRALLALPFATLHVCCQQENSPIEPELEQLGFVREEDVLDTWFSSALWPHSTLGWPEKTEALSYYYPTSTLITSRDIITLWVARMVIAGLNNVGEIPFHEVFIHPKILDGYGETMSKSKGNGIDPLDVIDKFGADALRFAMAYLTMETQDVRMPVQFECPHCEKTIEQTKKNRELPRIECTHCGKPFKTQWAQKPEDTGLDKGLVISERFEVSRNFMNKLWNASRFAMINLDGFKAGPLNENDLLIEDRWMLSRLATVTRKTTDAFENYRYGEAARELYHFAWEEFCSFFIEMLKPRFADQSMRQPAQRILAAALDHLLRLLHPIMPFITEEIWQLMATVADQRGFTGVEKASESIMIAMWPEFVGANVDETIESQFTQFQEALGALREIRARQNLAPKKPIDFSIKCDQAAAERLKAMATYFESMANAKLIEIGEDITIPKISAAMTLGELDVYVDLQGLIDVGAESKRLEKEKSRIQGQIQGKEKKLGNESFVSNAPDDVVARERESLDQLRVQMKKIEEAIESLSSMSAGS